MPHRQVAYKRISATRASATLLDTNQSLETNLQAHGRLDPDLKHLDLRLQLWAPWAKPHYDMGWPTRAVTERANEGGLLARDFAMQPSPEWPAEIVLTDRKVAGLPTRHQAAVMANYFHLAMESRFRAEVYRYLVRFLARTRPLHPRTASPAPLGDDAFRRDLDRARWTLKALLAL